MRNLINIIESLSILTEKSRGLLYRAKGDRFFTGKRDAPDRSIIFDKTEYFPGQPGAYDTHEDMVEAYEQAKNDYPNVTPSNSPTKRSKAFAILTMLDQVTSHPVYFIRFFEQIKPDMTGAWGNSDLPGGFHLDKETSLKAGYKMKPSDIFPGVARFKDVYQLLQAFKSSAEVTSFVPGFEMLFASPRQFPIFENASEFYTAIRDDLGEIIGPVALIQGLDMGTGAKAAARDLLDGGDWSGSSISFPSGKTNGLVDSYIVTSNGVEVGISSKGEKGATASVKNISDGVTFIRTKGSEEQRKLLVKYADQIKILQDISTATVIDFPLMYGTSNQFISQEAAGAIHDLITSGAKNLDEIDIDEDTLLEITNLISYKGAKTDLPNYNVGYHVLAALADIVANDINQDPKFGEACLKFLNSSPTMQLHMSAAKQKDGDVVVTKFISKYPPNFKGTVELDASKNYSGTSAGGRITFAYHGEDAGMGDTQEDPTPMSADSFASVADTVANSTYNPLRSKQSSSTKPKHQEMRSKRK